MRGIISRLIIAEPDGFCQGIFRTRQANNDFHDQ